MHLKAFLNEEIGRLKNKMDEIKNFKVVTENDDYKKNIAGVAEKLKQFSKNPIDEKMIHEIFYIQNLVTEISKNGD